MAELSPAGYISWLQHFWSLLKSEVICDPVWGGFVQEVRARGLLEDTFCWTKSDYTTWEAGLTGSDTGIELKGRRDSSVWLLDNPSLNNPERSANVVEDEDNTAGQRECISAWGQDEFRSTVFCSLCEERLAGDAEEL